MITVRKPAATHAPTPGSAYYRLKWQEPDGRNAATAGGRTLEDARAKATEIDVRVSMAAGPNAVTSLGDLVAVRRAASW